MSTGDASHRWGTGDAQSVTRRAPDWRECALLFLLLWLLYGVLIHTRNQVDFNLQQMGVEAIVERGRFSVEGSPTPELQPGGDVFEYGGHLYAAKQPGQFMLASLPYTLLRALGLRYLTDFTLVASLVTFFTSSLLTAAAAVAVYLLASVLAGPRASPTWAWGCAITYALGTTAFPYAGILHHDAMSSSFLVMALALAYGATRGDGPRRQWLALGAGVLLGFSITTSMLPFFMVLVVGLYVLARREWHVLPYFLVGGLIGLLPLFWYDTVNFGNPLALPNIAGNYADTFFYLDPANFVEKSRFYAAFISQYVPIFWLGVAGLALLPGYLRRELVTLFTMLAVLGGYILNIETTGDCQYGPRYLLPAMPIAAIGLVGFSHLQSTRRRRLAGIAIAVVILLSIGLNSVGAVGGGMYCEITTYAFPRYWSEMWQGGYRAFPLAGALLPLIPIALAMLLLHLNNDLRRAPGKTRRFGPGILLFPIALPALWPFFAAGFPEAEEGVLHLMRLVVLDASLEQGILYPTWAPSLQLGLGHPFLTRYAPAPYYLVLTFHRAGLAHPEAFITTLAVLALLSLSGCFLLIREFGGRNRSWVALLLATAYLYVPFLVAPLLRRGALPELAGLALLPWLFLSIRPLLAGQGARGFLPATLTLSLLALTHFTLFLLALLSLAVLIAISWRSSGVHPRSLAPAALAVLAALSGTSFFWLPYLRETGVAFSVDEFARLVTPLPYTAGTLLSLLALTGALFIAFTGYRRRLSARRLLPLLAAIPLTIYVNQFVSGGVEARKLSGEPLDLADVAQYEARTGRIGLGWETPRGEASIEPVAPGTSNVQLELQRAEPYLLEFRSTTRDATQLHLPVADHPGWVLSSPPEENGGRSDTPSPLLAVALPGGDGRVLASWQGGAAQRTGMLLSVATLLLLGVALWSARRRVEGVAVLSILLLPVLVAVTPGPQQRGELRGAQGAPPGVPVLLGSRVERASESRLRAEAYWHLPFSVVAPRIHWQLVREDGSLLSEETGAPYFGTDPLPVWPGGAVLRNIHHLALPPALPAGAYEVRAQLLAATGETLTDVETLASIVLVESTPAPEAFPLEGNPVFGEGIQFLRNEPFLNGLPPPAREGAILVRPGDEISYWLTWLATGDPEGDVVARVELVGDDGTRLSFDEHTPGGFYHSPLQWSPFYPVRDLYTLPVPSDAPGAIYRPHVTMLNSDTMEPLPLRDGGEAEIGASLILPPIKVVSRAAPSPQHPREAHFEGLADFPGYDLVLPAGGVHPGDTLAVTLYYRSTWMPARDYTAFVHLYSPEHGLIAQHDSLPRAGANPTSTWQPEEVIVHHSEITIPANAPPGAYQLLTGFYEFESGNRVPVVEESPGTSGDHVLLQDVNVTR